MSTGLAKREAIRSLQDALRVASLPSPESPSDAFVKDASGELTAANCAYQCGYMESAIKIALQMLGAKP